MIKALTLILIISTSIAAQFIEQQLFSFFPEVPHAQLKTDVFGSYGFSGVFNKANPQGIGWENGLHLSASSGLLVSGGRKVTQSDILNTNAAPYKSSFRAAPNILAAYKNNHAMIQVSYTSPVLFQNKLERGTTTYRLETPSGFYSITSPDREIKISLKELQLAVSYSPTPSLFFTAGIVSPQYQHELDLGVIDPIRYETSLLKQIQFIGSMNSISPGGVHVYLYGRSQKSGIKTTDGIFSLDGASVSDSYAKVSFPGIIGYGVKSSSTSAVQVALEVRHKFLVAEEEVRLTSITTITTERKLWSNEVSAGMTYQKGPVQLGALFAMYLKYDNYRPLYIYDNFGDPYVYTEIDKPYSLVLSGKIDLPYVQLFASYQFSKSNYRLRDDTTHQDRAHFISLGLSYHWKQS